MHVNCWEGRASVIHFGIFVQVVSLSGSAQRGPGFFITVGESLHLKLKTEPLPFLEISPDLTGFHHIFIFGIKSERAKVKGNDRVCRNAMRSMDMLHLI